MKKIFQTILLVALCVVFYGTAQAQRRVRYGGGEVAATSAGAINITPKAGQGVSIGGGAALAKVMSATASLDFGATAAGACDVLTITVTGAADGDTVDLGIPHALANADNYQSFHAWVSAADTVSVKRCNLTNATTALTNPAAATVRATVLKFL